MENQNIHQPSEAELEILQVIWEHEPVSVKFIHQHISEKKSVGYTTVLKQLQRMTEKGMVSRTKTGKVHFYKAVPKESEVQNSFFQRLKNTAYRGSAMKLIMHALGQSNTTEKELKEIQEWIELQKKMKNGDEK